MNQPDLSSGSVLGTVLRLVVISVIVGIVLSALGINASNLVASLNMLARRIYDLGFGAFEGVLGYFLVGAMVVIPIWLVAWVFRRASARRN
jgi:Family of unknown function (DUF6460)